MVYICQDKTLGLNGEHWNWIEYNCTHDVQNALGVYAVRVGVLNADGIKWHNGVANVGNRPTFGGEEVILEAHLINFTGNLYGCRIAVSLIDFIRAEKKFDGLDALKAQIVADCQTARGILQEPGANET